MYVNKVKALIKLIIGSNNTTKVILYLDKAAGFTGNRLLQILPGRVERIGQENFTLVNSGRRNIIDVILRAGMARQALLKCDVDQLALYHKNFWAGDQGEKYHDQNRYVAEDLFLINFEYIVYELLDLLRKHQNFKIFCEIGTGSGQLLGYLAEYLPTIDRFIGIDLNPKTIADNRKRFDNAKLEFIAADGYDWIRQKGQQNCVFFSYRGVLEYITQKKLQEMLNFIALKLSPAIFIAIEPVGLRHDLEKELNSKRYGREFSFSHNYPFLFHKAGFEVIHQNFKNLSGYRFCAVIAVAGI